MKNIVIIGAGPAGLSAAYYLLKNSKEYNVIILEENKQVGGIAKTINYKGNRIDIGGHRFFTKSKEVENLWLDLLPLQSKNSFDDKILNREKNLPKKGKNPEKEDKVMLLRNRVSRILFENKFYDYPIKLSIKTLKNIGLVRTITCGFSYLKYKVKPTKENNLEEFYINRFGKKLYTMFFENYTEKVWGVNPKNISKDWGSQRVKGISISEVLKDYLSKLLHLNNKSKETSLIESFYYPKYGPGQLYETMADEIIKMKGKIIKNSKVVNIDIKNNSVNKITYINNNERKIINPDIVISSMPIKDLVNSFNKTDKEIKRISNNLPYRDFITVGILVNKLKLKNMTKIKTINNNIPDCWLYIQDRNVKLGRIQIFNNWSPYMVKKPLDTVWIGLEYFCSYNDSFWNKTDNELKEYAKEELRRINVIDENEKIIDSCVIKIEKAYPAYFGSYNKFDKVKNYLNTIDNLYCVGRNGQHRYNNMDHSILTAIKASELIINNDTNKEELWKINTEEEYHEEK